MIPIKGVGMDDHFGVFFSASKTLLTELTYAGAY